eukprot:scaffold237481_cov20-Cyclotella_meneghiniana.AAC.1
MKHQWIELHDAMTVRRMMILAEEGESRVKKVLRVVQLFLQLRNGREGLESSLASKLLFWYFTQRRSQHKQPRTFHRVQLMIYPTTTITTTPMFRRTWQILKLQERSAKRRQEVRAALVAADPSYANNPPVSADANLTFTDVASGTHNNNASST